MHYFLRILSVCFCVFAFTHVQAKPPTAPVLDQITMYNQVATTLPGTFTNIPTNTTISLTFDQDVSRVGGTAFTLNENVTALFSLVDSGNAAVVFTATINGRVVTIILTPELRASNLHTIRLLANSVEEDITNIPNAIQIIPFTTATAINPVPPDRKSVV